MFSLFSKHLKLFGDRTMKGITENYYLSNLTIIGLRVFIFCFTMFQGLEIVNPQAAEKSGIESNKYFSNTAGFVKIQKT